MHTRCTAALLGAIVAPAGWAGAGLVDITAPGTTIQDVLDGGGSFCVGDKLFTIEDYFSVAFAANTIGIRPLDFGNAGRGFALADAWVDGTPGDAVAFDFTLSYSVEIIDDPTTAVDESQSYFIVDNRLTFDGAASVPGSFARVDETVMDETGALLGEKSVFAFGDGTSLFEDELDFDPALRLQKLHIVKDAEFFAVQGGTASASFIGQTFSQIPAPGSIAVALTGLGIVGRRRH